jgi:NAD(P)-dependent dehydrogenase (short-subunit alcohol dehydrogenase family)
MHSVRRKNVIVAMMAPTTRPYAAGLYAYIASDEARFLNGAVINMDGGTLC